jgi:hypothetical protein
MKTKTNVKAGYTVSMSMKPPVAPLGQATLPSF